MPAHKHSGLKNTLRDVIILAATPIGNLGDASKRLIETLETVGLIAAEDTRKTRHLMQLLEVQNRPTIVSYTDYNESAKAADLIRRAAVEDVLVVSDAGMPTVQDPGFKLVQLAVEAGVQVSVLPGPSAVVSALAVSGLPTDRFAFDGFVPRKASERSKLTQSLKKEQRTVILFESPNRLAETLSEFATALGEERKAVVCRELTKLHEEVKRGSLGELAEWAGEGVRGEIVLVIAGAEEEATSVEAVLPELLARAAAGERLKDAAREIAQATNLSVRELYEAALQARH